MSGMSERRTISLKMQIALLVSGLAVVGMLAMAGGWMARSQFNRSAHPPTATMKVTLTATTAAAMTAPAALPTTSEPPATPPLTASSTPTEESAGPRPTATLRPTPAASPTPEVITVRPGEGLYAVCRRYCPEQWGPGIPPDLQDYAHRVAVLNGLRWEPELYMGQRLKMPPCPSLP